MKEFTVKDVALRGRGFTLYPVCEKMNVSRELADNVLWAMHIGAGTVGKVGFANDEQMEVKASNPVLPNVISKENFRNAESIDECVAAGLIVEKDGHYEITEKMENILEETKKKSDELDASGFHFCPCAMF